MPFYPFLMKFHVYKMINDAINMLKSSLQLPQNFPEKGLPARAPLWPLERTVKSPKTAGRLFSPLERASLRSSVQSKIRISGSSSKLHSPLYKITFHMMKPKSQNT